MRLSLRLGTCAVPTAKASSPVVKIGQDESRAHRKRQDQSEKSRPEADDERGGRALLIRGQNRAADRGEAQRDVRERGAQPRERDGRDPKDDQRETIGLSAAGLSALSAIAAR